MRNVIVKIISFFIITLTACVALSQSPTTEYVPQVNTYINKLVYIDGNFSDIQKQEIISALHSWECTEKGIINYHISGNNLTIKEYQQLVNTNNILFIAAVKADVVEINASDKKLSGKELNTVGLFFKETRVFGPIIYIVSDRIREDNYRAVAMHEIGHSLGLVHTTSKKSIMNSNIDDGPKNLTKEDVVQFCDLYHCNPAAYTACNEE